MPRNTTYRHYDLKFAKGYKKTLTINKFMGVDYGLAQLQVADYHAVDLQNIIFKDRVNQKRHGWQQLAKMSNTTYYVEKEDGTYEQRNNTYNFNGIWSFVGEDNQVYVVAHIGKLLYKITGIGKGMNFLNCNIELVATSKVYNGVIINVAKELEDYKSQAFYGNKRLYILGGNKYYVLRGLNSNLNLKEVEDDENTYIPVTTIGIVAANSLSSGESSLGHATSLDDVNLMTQYRKNKLVTGMPIASEVKKTRYNDYELDTSINPKKNTDINNIKVTINSLKESEVE
jgi:hypothetical protein